MEQLISNNTPQKTDTMQHNSFPEFKLSLSHKQKPSERKQILSAKDAADVFKEIFDADTIEWVESFIILCLNKAHKVIGFSKISSGGVSGTVADPRVIMQFAILSNASSLILCHNHPSGNLTPSRQDEALTQKIKLAAGYFEMKVIDHIIITGDEGYYSFADEGIL